MAKTVILMDGKNGEIWCELLPREEGDGSIDRARIIRGTIGTPGDVVGKTIHLTWLEVAELVAPGKTSLSPLDLYFCEGRAGDVGEDEIVLDELPDKRGDWNAALNLAAEDSEYKRALDEAFASHGDIALRSKRDRRRKSGQAA